jgi:hypothetical protein
MVYRSFIDLDVEDHWSKLCVSSRAILLVDLGVDGEDGNILEGKTMDEIIQIDVCELPSEVRARLVLAVTDEGFSKREYERMRNEIRESAGNPSCERGN